MTGEITYEFMKMKNVIWAVFASWTYLNANDVEVIGYLFEIWDRGQTINIAVNFPILGETENIENTDLVAEGLASLEFR